MQELNSFIEESSKWLTEKAFTSKLYSENFCINLLWIFSQPRIYPNNKKILQICRNCLEKLRNRGAEIKNFLFIQDSITEAENSLSNMLGRLPSIHGCLTAEERDLVDSQLKSIEITDECFEFKNSTQYKNLRKLKSLTSVSSFLDNYDELLEKATSSESTFSNKAGSIIQYILMTDDQIKDSVGLLGLVDDIYALETLNTPEFLLEVKDLKWESELKSPNFRYPILVDENGSNLFNNADSLLKCGILNSSKPEHNLRLIKEQNPKILALLISILSTIANIKIRVQKIKTLDPYELEPNTKYEIFLKESHSIILEFIRIQEINDQEFFMFKMKKNKKKNKMDDPNTICSVPAYLLRKRNFKEVDENSQLSNEDQYNEFIKSPNLNIPGLYPFKSTRNLEYELKKSALICPKNTFNLLAEITIEGKTVTDWFGYKYIKRDGKTDEKIGLLSSEPLLIHTTDVDNLLEYLDENPSRQNEIQTINYVEKREVNFSALTQFKKLNDSIGINIFLEIWTNHQATLLQEKGFKLVANKKEGQINTFPFKEDSISSYLAKIGSLSKVSYQIFDDEFKNEYKRLIFSINSDNNEINYILHRLWGWTNKQNLLLESDELEDRRKKFDDAVKKLEILKSHDEGIPELLSFIKKNTEEILQFNKFSIISDWLRTNDSNCCVLLSQKDCKKLQSITSISNYGTISHDFSSNTAYMHELETNAKGNINKILIPSILDRKTIEMIIKSNYAKEIVVVCDTAEREKIEAKVNSYRGIDKQAEEEKIEASLKDSIENIFQNLNPTELTSNYVRKDDDSDDHEIEATAIHFEDGSKYFIPETGDIIASSHLTDLHSNLIKKKGMEIEVGDYIMIPDRFGGSLSDFILDSSVPDIFDIRESAKSWKILLKNFIDQNNLTFEQASDTLQTYANIKREPGTIKNWILNDHLIAPQNLEESITSIFKALGDGKSYSEEAKACINNCNKIYKLRRFALENLLNILRNPVIDKGKLRLEYEEKVYEFDFLEIIYVQNNVQINHKDLYHVINE